MSDRDVTVAPDDYTAKLMAELTRVLDERDTLNAKFEVSQSMRHSEYEQYIKENAKLRAQLAELKRVAESKQDIIDHMRDANAENARLRERITTQKQTIQAYRDESREWREVAERAQAKNEQLRELVRVLCYCMQHGRECDGCRLNDADGTITAPVGCDGLHERLRALGIEED